MFILLAIHKRLRSIVLTFFVVMLLGFSLLYIAPISGETGSTTTVSTAPAAPAASTVPGGNTVADGPGGILPWLTCYIGSCGMG